MKRELLFELASPYRCDFRIQAFRFGEGDHAAAIVGAIRGDELQQLFICSQLIKNLSTIEAQGLLSPGHEILVIPQVNHYSLNISKRFWAMDGTDINRMFPGYDKGETTQRIAAALFEAVRGYTYGIQLASFYLHGDFIPHVRQLKTGYEDVEKAKQFGLPYVVLREPSSFDTVTLNYNWQIFETKAFSVYSGDTEEINKDSAKVAWNGILRFLARSGIIRHKLHNGYDSVVLNEKSLTGVTGKHGGFLYKIKNTGDSVKKGELLAKILDPCDGSVLSEIFAPVSGDIFFSHRAPLISENMVVFKLA
ncbi:MAG: succinylglutamate desuccinylase/aspartoacylase family protein [Spirochaetaceae bacterium]|jgi:predicted deacylase|nr:succinylglutamate desuccinylase/aspartoacylase family protein [Spirochaetaceae bacterium]